MDISKNIKNCEERILKQKEVAFAIGDIWLTIPKRKKVKKNLGSLP